MRAKIVDATEAGLMKAAEYIKAGKIVIFPSDCTYGFATNATIVESVLQIYKIKRRPRNKPLCILTSKNNAKKYGYINTVAEKLIESFWPGPLGIIVKKKNIIPDVVTAGKESVALVCMDDIAVKLSNYAGVPIAVTSANFSNEPPIIDDKEAIETFGDIVDMIIRGGQCKFCVNTTLIDLTNPTKLTVLREGPIAISEIEKIIKRGVENERVRIV